MPSAIGERAEDLAERIASLSTATVAEPVLVYFDIIGICWPIRCLLHISRVDYELIKVPIEAWIHRAPDGTQSLPASCRSGHLPLYVDRDVHLTQSNVIMAYLADRHGLFGDSPRQRLAITEVLGHAYDALFHWTGLFPVLIKGDIPDEVVESRLQAFLGHGSWGVMSDGYHRNLDAFERYMAANPDRDCGYMVGSRLSVADLHAFNVLCNWYKAFDPARFSKRYPRLDDYIGRIASIPGVDDYIRHRQERTTWFPLPQLALKLTSPGELAAVIAPQPV